MGVLKTIGTGLLNCGKAIVWLLKKLWIVIKLSFRVIAIVAGAINGGVQAAFFSRGTK